MRGKKPLSENHVKSLRKLVEGNELHELLLNLSVDLMLRGWDLLNLKVSDVLNESGTVKKEVRVKMKKTGKTKSSVIYDRTKNVDAVRRLLGQSSVTATSAYLGITDESVRQYLNN